MRRRRIAIGVGIAAAVLLTIVVTIVIVLTQTDYGRERTRRIVLSQLGGSVNGTVRIGGLSGNLLQGVTLSDFSISGVDGDLFLRADTLSFRYSARMLFTKRIHLSDARFVAPVIILDQPPGEEWNFARIFPRDTMPADTAAVGLGSWLRIADLTIRDGRLEIRNEWQPPDTLRGAALERAIAAALSEESRARVVAVRNGYQTIQVLEQLNAELPLLRLADPDSTDIIVDVASLSAVAYPFRPPAARIDDLSGRLVVSEDSIRFEDVRVELPESHFQVHGAVVPGTGDLRASLDADPIALADFRWIAPSLPDSGVGAVAIEVASQGGRTQLVAEDLDFRLGEARLEGRVEATLGDSIVVGPSEILLTDLDTRLVERLAPSARIPVDGVVDGRLALTGTSGDLDLDGEIVFHERAGGRSRITAEGGLAVAGDGGRSIALRDLRIRFDPLRVALARAFAPDLPVGGTIAGTATVNGSPTGELRIDSDLVHRDVTGVSRFTGRSRLVAAGRERLDTDLRLRPLSLRTLGRFAPAAGLHGSATGSLRASGSLEDLVLSLDLVVDGGGSLAVRGTLGVAGGLQRYDLETRLVGLDASRVSTRAPRTELTGSVTARGAGTAPATMRALVTADFADVRPDSVQVEAARVRVQIAEGLARVEEASLRMASARADIQGSFGLAPGREGEIAYRVEVDSLSDFAGYVPTADTLATAADTLASAADTLASAAEAGEQDSIAPGAASPSLAGTLHVLGTLSGNLDQFDLRGTAEIEDAVVAGVAIGGGRAELGWLEARSPAASFEVDLGLREIVARGFVFDSLSTQVRHRAADGHGVADLAVYKDERHEIQVLGGYDLVPDRKVVRLDSLRLRLEDSQWALVEPGAVRWGGRGVEVDRIELREAGGGRIYVDGRLPTEGAVDLDLAIEELEIGDLAALLPDTLDASGLLSLHVSAEGALADPSLTGDVRVADLMYAGGTVSAFEATFEYADTELAARAEVRQKARPLVIAEGTLPIDLSFDGPVEERLLDRPMRFDILLDRFVLDSLPQFTPSVTGLRGTMEGEVAVRGTPRSPDVEGSIRLDGAAADITPLGLELREVASSLSIREDVVVLDSLVARSDEGLIRASGEIDVTTLTRPGFDLAVETRDAKVLDNQQGRIFIDSDLTIEGPFDQVRVAGEIEVVQAVIYIPAPKKQVVDLDDPSAIAVIDTTRIDPHLRPRPHPLLANLQADVDVSIARNTWLRSPDVNIEIYTPAGRPLNVQVDQREQVITAAGTIQTDRGEYTFSGRRFEVVSGSIIFLGTPELNPLLQVLARHEVPKPRGEALEILITIEGTLAQPTLQLESNAQPPLSETDLLAYLAFGRSSSSLLVQGGSGVSGEGGDGGAAGSLGAIATQKLTGVALGALMEDALDDLEAGGLNELGLDVFRISPAELPDELALEEGGNVFRSTELEAGKYLTPRIFVAGQGRPVGALPGVRFEYRTPGGFVWTTSWEPRYLPSQPSFELDRQADQTRVFGSFLHWEWRY